jgi:hypothetical protein
VKDNNQANLERVQEEKRKVQESLRLQAHDEYLRSITPLTPEEEKNVPNIIFIMMDDLGWGDLSCFGSKAIHTPNIDRMAEEGAVLKNCYSASPICSPSRFGFLTGRYPSRGFLRNVFFPTLISFSLATSATPRKIPG